MRTALIDTRKTDALAASTGADFAQLMTQLGHDLDALGRKKRQYEERRGTAMFGDGNNLDDIRQQVGVVDEEIAVLESMRVETGRRRDEALGRERDAETAELKLERDRAVALGHEAAALMGQSISTTRQAHRDWEAAKRQIERLNADLRNRDTAEVNVRVLRRQAIGVVAPEQYRSGTTPTGRQVERLLFKLASDLPLRETNVLAGLGEVHGTPALGARVTAA